MNKVIYFYTDACGPCKMIRPIIENIDNDYNDLDIQKINAFEFKDLADKYNINSVPTLIFISNGEESSRLSGFFPDNKIRN